MMDRPDRRAFFRQSSGLAFGLAAGAALSRRAAAVPPIARTRPSRIKTSCSGYSFRDYLTGKKEPKMTLLDFVDLCADMGFDATEPTGYYFPNPVTPEFLAELKRRAHILGIDVSGTAIANDFCLPPGEKRAQQIAHVKQWIDYAAAFGANTIRIFSGSVPKDHTLEEAQNWFVECVEEACAYAGEKGVFLALENHGGISIPVDGMMTLLEKVKSPWFAINLDTGNFNSADPYADMAKVAPYSVNVQLKLEIRPQGGKTQRADMDRIVGLLKEAKYSGYVAIEHETKEDPMVDVPKALAQLREALRKAEVGG